MRGNPQRRSISDPTLLESLEARLLFAFGLTTTASTYTVDTGTQLVFSIARTAGPGSAGDLTSMKYNGTDLEAPFSVSGRYSHYESGLSGSTVVSARVDPNNQWILITCDDTAGVGVIQYYLARNGYNNIYMATYSPGPNSPSPGEMRFITYTNPAVLTNIPAPSDNNGSTGNIESTDVFGHADGTTTSKYYGEYQAIDTQTYGDTGNGFGIFMNIGNREASSGGPFFKDIDFQNNELYTYTFSGHSQTENFRPGLKGFYALEFTTGATPAAPDYSFIDTEGAGAYVTGYVGAAGRGTLTGLASGVPSTLQATVGLSNAADQYWATPNAGTGAYTVSGVLPGTYTETIYQGQLAVGNQTVTITAGHTTTQNISDALHEPSAADTIFRIGTWDGTPLGFLNADKITYMHPTDVRMSPWADATGMTNFVVGTDPDSSFPMAEWHAETASAPYVDTKNRITFDLTAAQAATVLTLRIGLTRLDQGRPTINVNSGVYNSPTPAQTAQPTSRGLTTGNWRGNNCTYSFNIPIGALHAGTNTIDISCTSGSTGTLYSGYQIYDAIDLISIPPNQLVFNTDPPDVVSGGTLASFEQVQLEDGFGNILTGNNSLVTLSLVGVGGTLQGTTTAVASQGVADFANLTVSGSGTYQLEATDGSFAPAFSNPFRVTTPGTTVATPKLSFTQQPSDILAGAQISPGIQVSVVDQDGVVETGVDEPITLSIASGTGTLRGTDTVEAINGVATFNNVIVDGTGAHIFLATDDAGVTSTSLSFNVTASANEDHLAFVPEPVDVTPGVVATPPVKVEIEDPAGNVVSTDANVTLSINSGPGALGGTVTVPAVDGVATFSNLQLSTMGAYTLAATSSVAASAISSEFQAVYRLAIRQAPTAVVAGERIAATVMVDILDQNGNVVSNALNPDVSLTIASGPSSVLHGTTTVAAMNGEAIFRDLSIDRAGTYTITASDSGATATSSSFTAIAGSPARLVFLTQPGDANVASPINQIIVAVEDNVGNIVAGPRSVVKLTVISAVTGRKLRSFNVTTVNGMAAFNRVAIKKAGSFILKATDVRLAPAVSDVFTVDPAAPALRQV